MLRPEVAGTLLVVLAAATIPALLPLAGVLGEARDALVEAFGLHVFTGTALLAALGGLIALRRTAILQRHSRHLLGGAAILVFSAGLLGLWSPETSVGSVALAEHSAGGDAGRWLTSGPYPLVAWLLLAPAAFTLLWPLTAREVARATPAVLAMLGLALFAVLKTIGRGIVGAGRSVQDRRARAAAETPPPFEYPSLDGIDVVPSLEDLEDSPAYGDFDDDAELDEPLIEPLPEEEEAPRRPVQWRMDLDVPAGELRHSGDGWQLPPLSLLAEGPKRSAEAQAADNRVRAQLIVDTLASFGVDATVTEVNEGPTVTQFGVEPGWDVRTRTIVERDADGNPIRGRDGQQVKREVEVARTRIRVNRITALQNDLALALAAPALRIEAPVPGKPMVGIEVPNTSVATVTLRDVMETQSFTRLAQKGALPIALGTGVSGEPVVADLAKMPHMLIAGATGSGKSVCLNSIITCLLMSLSPDELRLVMVDPKRVELTTFAPVPHLAFSRIIVEMDEVVGTLQAVINEMDTRYRRFSKEGVRNIEAYNAKADEAPAMKRLPYWVVVIDELADLMMAAPFQVESQLVRLAQLARATGIHLIVATQRPSVDVVTGLIKANFPTRVAFAMASQVDSRTVLDQVGAEKLLGRGDMLYVPTDAQKPKRVQGVFVADREIEEVVEFWSSDRFASIVPEKHDEQLKLAQLEVEQLEEAAAEAEDSDPIVQKAIALARQEQKLSTSMLQRKLRIGYPRAARVMDELEERGIVGPPEGGGSSRPVIFAAMEAPLAPRTAVDDAEPF